jgi:sugar-specific transcriptional regulator TrmB
MNDYTSLGLSVQEYAVYESILKQPPVNIVALSQELKINRTTLYAILESLLKKKLIVEALPTEKIKYKAVSPEELLVYAKSVHQKSIDQVKQLEERLPLLKHFFGAQPIQDSTEIYMYRNDDNSLKMVEIVGKSKSQMYGFSNDSYIDFCFDLDKNGKVIPNEYYEIVMRVGERFVFTGDEESYKYAVEFIKKNPELKDKWEGRWIDKKRMYFDININTFEDVVTFGYLLNEPDDWYTVFMRNPAIAKSMQGLSQFMWENAKPLY